MKKLNLVVLVGLCVALTPAVVQAGGTGACFVVTNISIIGDGTSAELGVDGFQIAACADGITQGDCEAVDVLVEFWEGATCEDVADKGQISWQGSCAATVPPAGDDVCIQLWTEGGGKATAGLCQGDIGGEFFQDLECGGVPVPTMPGFGMAALAMLILAGALIILSMRGSQASA